MSIAPFPSSTTAPQRADETGGLILITGTGSGDANLLLTPSVVAPSWQHVYLAAGSVHTATVKLTIGFGSTSAIFEQDIAPRSGLNPVLDWEEMRDTTGPLYVWAAVASVIRVKLAWTIQP